MEKRWRFCLLLLAMAVFITVYAKNRTVSQRKQAVFLRYTTGYLLVRVKGIPDGDGVYRFSDGATLHDVKKMTNGPREILVAGRSGLGAKLKNGDLVEITKIAGSPPVMTLKTMTANEKMLLGIPLDPDAMTQEDWEALPGIGPALAKAIMSDRQKNGDFVSVEALMRVPGMGNGKLNPVRKYFLSHATH